MRIIPASFDIIEDQLENLSVCERIERCGRICYKSEDKITPESAVPFCERMLKNGHMSTLEMAVLHFKVPAGIQRINAMKEKYLLVDNRENLMWSVVSGSVRALLESSVFDSSIIHDILIGKIQKEDIESHLPSSMVPVNHKHIAVKFIVNRAVSHELVRHRPCSFLQESQRYCGYDHGKFDGEITFIDPSPFIINDAYGIDYKLWKDACASAEKTYMQLRKNGHSPQAARTVLPNSTKTELILYASLQQWEHIFKLRCSYAADPSMRGIMIPLRDEFEKRGWL